MTMSLAAVFIPVLFMGGILGRLLHEFAVTISVAILVSGFVSLTPHAHAVQPLSAQHPRASATAVFIMAVKRSSTACCNGYTTGACKESCAHRLSLLASSAS